MYFGINDTLTNMGAALYGGSTMYNMPNYWSGYNTNTFNQMPTNIAFNPSFGYSNFNFNPNLSGYNYNGYDTFTSSQTASSQGTTASQASSATQAATTGDMTAIAKALSQEQPEASTSFTSAGLASDLDTLGKYYLQGMNPSENLASAAVGGAAFGLLNNPRMVVHPWNSIKSTRSVDKMFQGIKQASSKLGKMWVDKKGGQEILSEAYARMHKLEALNNSKLGLFRKSIKGVKGSDGKLVYDTLKKQMTSALASGDKKLIAEATEAIKRQTNAFTGYIPRFMKWAHIDKPFAFLRKKFINPSHYQDLTKVAGENVKKAAEKTTFGQFMKHSCGIGNGAMFAALEVVMDLFNGKIQSAFSKDSETGWKQVGQTALKGVGSAVGWAVGEGIGAWAGAKLGAMAGTAIAPGVGTAIGAVAGLIGGSIGCWLTGKLTHKIIGTEAGDQVKLDEMKKSKEGIQQLCSITLEQAKNDKNVDEKTLQAIQNVAQAIA